MLRFLSNPKHFWAFQIIPNPVTLPLKGKNNPNCEDMLMCSVNRKQLWFTCERDMFRRHGHHDICTQTVNCNSKDLVFTSKPKRHYKRRDTLRMQSWQAQLTLVLRLRFSVFLWTSANELMLALVLMLNFPTFFYNPQRLFIRKKCQKQ